MLVLWKRGFEEAESGSFASRLIGLRAWPLDSWSYCFFSFPFWNAWSYSFALISNGYHVWVLGSICHLRPSVYPFLVPACYGAWSTIIWQKRTDFFLFFATLISPPYLTVYAVRVIVWTVPIIDVAVPIRPCTVSAETRSFSHFPFLVVLNIINA
jgi:hypothetical protein